MYNIQRIPKNTSSMITSGVYFLFIDSEIVYIGQSVNVYSRLDYHKKWLDYDTYYVHFCNKEELSEFEAAHIFKYQPVYNKQMPTSRFIKSLESLGTFYKYRTDEVEKLVNRYNIEVKKIGGKNYVKLREFNKKVFNDFIYETLEWEL